MNAVLAPAKLERPLIDSAFLTNPYATYRALQEAGPIHWSEEFFGGAWLLTRHADVELVLKDPRFRRSAPAPGSRTAKRRLANWAGSSACLPAPCCFWTRQITHASARCSMPASGPM